MIHHFYGKQVDYGSLDTENACCHSAQLCTVHTNLTHRFRCVQAFCYVCQNQSFPIGWFCPNTQLQWRPGSFRSCLFLQNPKAVESDYPWWSHWWRFQLTGCAFLLWHKTHKSQPHRISPQIIWLDFQTKTHFCSNFIPPFLMSVMSHLSQKQQWRLAFVKACPSEAVDCWKFLPVGLLKELKASWWFRKWKEVCLFWWPQLLAHLFLFWQGPAWASLSVPPGHPKASNTAD